MYRGNKVVEVNATVTLTDDAGKKVETDQFHLTLDYHDKSEADLHIDAARTNWITIQGFIRKHWKAREEIRDKRVTFTELSEFFQKHSEGKGGFGLPALAQALVKAGKDRETAIAIAKDPIRAAKAEAWLKSLEVPEF